MDAKDLYRLSIENVNKPGDETIEEWLKNEGIDLDVIDSLNEWILNYYEALAREGYDFGRIFQTIVLDSFRIGYSCGKEFGHKTDLSGVDQA